MIKKHVLFTEPGHDRVVNGGTALTQRRREKHHLEGREGRKEVLVNKGGRKGGRNEGNEGQKGGREGEGCCFGARR